MFIEVKQLKILFLFFLISGHKFRMTQFQNCSNGLVDKSPHPCINNAVCSLRGLRVLSTQTVLQQGQQWHSSVYDGVIFALPLPVCRTLFEEWGREGGQWA